MIEFYLYTSFPLLSKVNPLDIRYYVLKGIILRGRDSVMIKNEINDRRHYKG